MNEQVQAIRAEIERLLEEEKCYEWVGKKVAEWAYRNVLSFIDSLPEIEGNSQKVPLIPKAQEGEVGHCNQRGLSILLDNSLEKLGCSEGDKVKIIILTDESE